MTNLDRVREFAQAFGVSLPSRPQFLEIDREELRLELIREEFYELKAAIESCDMAEVADALADLTYVVFGMALEMGIPLDAVFAEVHRSNMTKLGDDGKPVYRSDGKITKGPRFEAPKLGPILEAAGWREKP